MEADALLRYLGDQIGAIQALIDQLDEVQVAFNAQFDTFKAQHDATLGQLTDQVASQMDAIGPDLREAIGKQRPEELRSINERRAKVREQYLPQRQQAADTLLQKAQAEVAELRALNPQLDEREEGLKRQKAILEARLAELNEEIRRLSRGLGVVSHFLAITRADRERHKVLGKLESVSGSLHDVRKAWEQRRKQAMDFQSAYQEQWELETMAVARLQAELDQLDDEIWREDLALRRAIHHVLDNLKELGPGHAPELETSLRRMVELNIRTDDYHGGLASVGGLIGLSGGIRDGLKAVIQSVESLRQEQQMHAAYLKPLSFSLPSEVNAFHNKWPLLARQFADENTISSHPADFAARVRPLLQDSLSQARIEAMFSRLNEMIQQATADW